MLARKGGKLSGILGEKNTNSLNTLYVILHISLIMFTSLLGSTCQQWSRSSRDHSSREVSFQILSHLFLSGLFQQFFLTNYFTEIFSLNMYLSVFLCIASISQPFLTPWLKVPQECIVFGVRKYLTFSMVRIYICVSHIFSFTVNVSTCLIHVKYFIDIA